MKLAAIMTLFILSLSYFSSEAAILQNTCKSSGGGQYEMIHYSDTNFVSFTVKDGAEKVFVKRFTYTQFMKLVGSLVHTGQKYIENANEIKDSDLKDFTIYQLESSFSFDVSGIKFDNCFEY